MDRYKLEYFIKERGKTKEELRMHLGISKSAMHRKIAGMSEFTLDEINKIVEFLNLSNDEILEVFFTSKVS